ncbi:hypothetical protein EV207_13838 [Scopulibacillus darangshiensis]|uniref:Uncharacterized protein n=1 Tax=Scopulibacillus darangshiensis TaxID=442528 RepID=A0A4R2NKG6_9BACL|nr:hypothetical protein [Scopulibacillus darangshiensis]TCP21951.1 hypothetical protein EV207_13838 [Scopulibacillus darangshiensis]
MYNDPRNFMNGMPPMFNHPNHPFQKDPGPFLTENMPQHIPYNVLNTLPFKPGVNISRSQAQNPHPYPFQEEYKKMADQQPQQFQSYPFNGDKVKDNEAKNEQSQKQKNKKKKKKSKPKAMISFDKLSAGSLAASSGIFNGKNIQFGWSAHSKTNNGFGTLSGNHNNFHDNYNIVFDNDQIDTPIDDRDVMWSPIPTS